MATRRVVPRVTEADLMAEIVAHQRAARTAPPPTNRTGAAANRAKTCCPKCGGAYTRDGSRHKCLPCDREANTRRQRAWTATAEGRQRQRAAWNRFDAKRRGPADD